MNPTKELPETEIAAFTHGSTKTGQSCQWLSVPRTGNELPHGIGYHVRQLYRADAFVHGATKTRQVWAVVFDSKRMKLMLTVNLDHRVDSSRTQA